MVRKLAAEWLVFRVLETRRTLSGESFGQNPFPGIFPEWAGTFEPYLTACAQTRNACIRGNSLFLTTDPSATFRNGEEGRCRAGPEEGEEVGREEVMGVS